MISLFHIYMMVLSGCRSQMQELRLKLWRNDDAGDWSIEINRPRHEHITSEIMEDLVECALIASQKSLAEAATRPAQ